MLSFFRKGVAQNVETGRDVCVPILSHFLNYYLVQFFLYICKAIAICQWPKDKNSLQKILMNSLHWQQS